MSNTERQYGLFSRPKGSPKGTRWTRVFPNIGGNKRSVVVRGQSVLINACFSGPDVIEVRPLPKQRQRA
jgi:hypothetical protein